MPGAPLNAHLRLLSDPGPPVRSRKRKKHSETKHPPHGKWRCGRIANAVNLSARSSFNKVTSSKTRLSSIFLCRSATKKSRGRPNSKQRSKRTRGMRMRRTRLASCAVIASQRRRGQPGLAARRTSSRKAKERNGKEVARELKQNMRRSKRTRAACEFKRTLRHLPHGDPAPWASQVEQRAARGTSAEERNRRGRRRPGFDESKFRGY
jgi:hypothetical protein